MKLKNKNVVLKALSGKRKEVMRLFLGVGCEEHTIPQIAEKLGMTEQEVKLHEFWARLEFVGSRLVRKRHTLQLES